MGRYHQYETHFFSDGNVIVIVKFNFVQNYYISGTEAIKSML